MADSYCCFMSYTEGNEDTKLCIKLTKAQYDDRDSFISNLKEDSSVERLELLCDGDSGESNQGNENEGDENSGESKQGNENDGGDSGESKQGNENENNEPELKYSCDVKPNSYDDELGDCKKMTVTQGNYCCLLSYDLGDDGNGKSCISLTKDEYDDRNKAISKLLKEYPNAKGEILCDEDSDESKQGNENENNEPELKNFCDVWPNSYDDKLEYCKKMTVAKGNYCCLLSYDLGEDGNGKSCISLTKDEYDDRNKAISKLLIDFPNGKGEILCDGDNSSTFIKLTKSLIGLLLIIL